MTPGPIFAMLAASLPGIAQGAVGHPPSTVAVLGAVVFAGLIAGVFGVRWAERRSGDRALHLFIAIYGTGCAVAIGLSDGGAFLVSMPLVSMFVLFLPIRAALGWTTLVVAWLVFSIHAQVDEPKMLALAAVGSCSAYAFVIVFSVILRREAYARRDLALLNAELEVLATTRERNRIAREIHDSLGHYLTVANVQLEAARAAPDGAEARLQRVQQLLKDGLGELRRSVSVLREGPLPPFSEALGELVAGCNDTGLQARLSTIGTSRPVPPAIGFTLYRVTQEALTNVQRHAKAKTVAITLDYQPARLVLSVADDGVGTGGASEGNGLKGLRERVALAGGTVKVEQPAGGGLQLVVAVPA